MQFNSVGECLKIYLRTYKQNEKLLRMVCKRILQETEEAVLI